MVSDPLNMLLNFLLHTYKYIYEYIFLYFYFSSCFESYFLSLTFDVFIIINKTVYILYINMLLIDQPHMD